MWYRAGFRAGLKGANERHESAVSEIDHARKGRYTVTGWLRSRNRSCIRERWSLNEEELDRT